MQKKQVKQKMIFEMHRIATVCFPIFQQIYFETTHSEFPWPLGQLCLTS